MPRAKRPVKKKEDYYGMDPRELTPEELSFIKFKEDHGSVEELAKLQGREQETKDQLQPVFDSVLGLVQIVTKGDPDKVRKLTRNPGRFFETLMEDEGGALRGFLLARAMHEVVNKPSKKDPLEWARFIIDVMAMSKAPVQIPERQGGELHLGAKRAPASITDEILRGLGHAGERTQGEEGPGS